MPNDRLHAIVLLLAFAACSVPAPTHLTGGCGSGCADGQVCLQNACVSPCLAGGGTSCDGGCVNLASDHANCGSCGNQCQSGLVCANGSCAATCGPDLTSCLQDGGGSYCVNLASDPTNCGACGQVCPSGMFCQDAGCTQISFSCPTNQELCTEPDGGALCLDPQTDHDNCGACGRACASDQDCYGGACVTPCMPGLSHCPGPGGTATCVSLAMADDNCGQCGLSCGPNGFCSRSACQCNAGFTQCGSVAAPSCAQLPSDLMNCGACGQRCVSCETCNMGVCTAQANILSGFVLPVDPSRSTVGIAIGDFNADGLPDLAVTTSSSGDNLAQQLQIFYGDGGGGFPSSVTTLAGNSISYMSLGAADFNADGLTDLAVATMSTGGGTGFMILYGQSDGGLLASSVIASEPTETSQYGQMRIADFNGDGRNDVALLNPSFGVDVYYSLIDVGGFSFAGTLALGSSLPAEGMDVGDLNGDGLVDVAISYSGTTAIYLQAASGFEPALTVATAATTSGFTTQPIVSGTLLNSISDGDDSIFRFEDGGMVLTGDLAISYGEGYGGVSVDLNGDGIPDLVLNFDYSPDVYVFLGRNGGTPYGAPAVVGTGNVSLAQAWSVGDLNGDGRLDIAEADGTAAAVLLNGCQP